MEIEHSEVDKQFRGEVREFIQHAYPDYLREKVTSGKEFIKEDFQRWQKILYEKGWAAPAWPEEYGGTGWTVSQRYIFQEELAYAGTLNVLPFGLKMLAPVLMKYGSQEQKDKFLPRILSGEDWWCQGYSEPGAGSDLASLATKAAKKDNSYIINGMKTWTSWGHWADWMFCLVRTDTRVKKQEGISFILIDMNSPGITVRPIITIDGVHEVNEVFFDNVVVPSDNLVGEENKGWTYAKTLLSHERSGTAEVARSKYGLAQIRKQAQKYLSDGRMLIEDSTFSSKLAQLEIDLLALEYSELRAVIDLESLDPMSAVAPSILKIKGSEIQQRVCELALEVVGYDGFAFSGSSMAVGSNPFPMGPGYTTTASSEYFNMRKSTIYGGSNEIQRNIISKTVFGLR